MKENMRNNRGFTLVEVLASIVIIFILFTLISNYFIKSYEQSNYLNREYTSTQLCESLLKVYRSKPYSTLIDDIGTTKEISNIEEVLQLDSTEKLDGYSATVQIQNHPDDKLTERAIIVIISVSQHGKEPIVLEGIVRK